MAMIVIAELLPLLLLLASWSVESNAFAGASPGRGLFKPGVANGGNSALPATLSPVADEGVDEATCLVPESLLSSALKEAVSFSTMDAATLGKDGWMLVHDVDMFKLWKRKTPSQLYEYLMIGHVADVSPRDFLAAQLDKRHRDVWDTSMSAMECLLKPPRPSSPLLHCRAGSSSSSSSHGSAQGLESGHAAAEDRLYYRTKWPWPLKDREYVLARRCRQYDQQRALVFVSRSTELETARPIAKGAIRVENYWCHSTFLAAGAGAERVEAAPVATTTTAVSDHDEEGDIITGESGQGGLLKDGPFGGVQRLGRMQLAFKKRQGSDHASPRVSIDPFAAHDVGLDTPGTTFVTHFCDDSKVPLPSSIVEKIAKVAEAKVPPSMQRLHQCAREITAAIHP